MNEKHLVIFYGVLYMIVKMLNLESEVHFLKDDEEDMQNLFYLKYKKSLLNEPINLLVK